MSNSNPIAPATKNGLDPDQCILLVCVLFVVFVLIGVLIPVMSTGGTVPGHGGARTSKTAFDLRSAIMMYVTEYKRFPALPGLPADGDALIDTSEAHGLISVMTGAPGNALADQLNPRRIAYFMDRTAKSAADPGLWYSGTGAHLKDQWGNYYRVIMDSDYNNQVDIKYPDGSVEAIYNVLVIHSLGKNGVMNRTPGFKDDDIIAQ